MIKKTVATTITGIALLAGVGTGAGIASAGPRGCWPQAGPSCTSPTPPPRHKPAHGPDNRKMPDGCTWGDRGCAPTHPAG